MGPKTAVGEGDLFQHPLREQINLKHPLVRLADLINWDRLGTSMSASFVSRKGRPATSPRLIAGLLNLQHAFDLSVHQPLSASNPRCTTTARRCHAGSLKLTASAHGTTEDDRGKSMAVQKRFGILHREMREYLNNFPHLAGTIHAFCGDERGHRRLLRALNDVASDPGDERSDARLAQQKPTRAVPHPLRAIPSTRSLRDAAHYQQMGSQLTCCRTASVTNLPWTRRACKCSECASTCGLARQKMFRLFVRHGSNAAMHLQRCYACPLNSTSRTTHFSAAAARSSRTVSARSS
ncbi:hypothetical protein QFZ98_004674 [Paraburkholderia youngii]